MLTQILRLQGFLEELKRNEMSEFVKDSENMSDLKKQTITKIRELQTRWSAVPAWATKRTEQVGNSLSLANKLRALAKILF
jgi:hypothetical protein